MDRLIAALRTLAVEQLCSGGCINGQQPMSLCQTCHGTGTIPSDPGAAKALEVLDTAYRVAILDDYRRCEECQDMLVGALLRAAPLMGYATAQFVWNVDGTVMGILEPPLRWITKGPQYGHGRNNYAALLAALTAAVEARCKKPNGRQ